MMKKTYNLTAEDVTHFISLMEEKKHYKIINDYIDSFAFTISSKRLNRFVGKAIPPCETFINEMFPRVDGKTSPLYDSLLDLMGYALLYHEEEKVPLDFSRVINDYAVEDRDFFENVESFLPDDEEHFIQPRFLEIAENEFKMSCQRYIRAKALSGRINESNFMNCVPQKTEDVLLLLTDVINGLWISVINELKLSSLESSVTDCETENLLFEKEQEIKQLRLEITAVNKEKDNLEKQIRYLKEEKETIRNGLIQRNVKDNEELVKERDFYKRKYESLLETQKEKSIEKTIKNEEEPQIPLQEENEKELDLTKHYVFVTGPHYLYAKKIENEFPNSVITTIRVERAQVIGADAVVFLTKNLKHSDYYKAKDICKDNNIPYVHTACINIDEIKKAMFDAFKECRLTKEE